MRIPARLTTTVVGVAALAVPLTGCITVHGAEAVVPAVSLDEAQDVLDTYAEVKNEVNPVYDAELNNTIDSRTLGTINEAMHTARHAVHPDGDVNYEPLEFRDPTFHIPQQQGWPKFFVADAPTNRNDTHHWLLVFTRDSPDEDWRASYMASVAAEHVPEFAADEDGHAEVVDPEESANDGAAPAPGELSAAYTTHLRDGEGPFADNNHTSGVLERRAEANQDPASAVQYIDTPADGDEFAPVGLRTEDGGALVFFTSHHSDQVDWADGESPVVDEYVEAVLEGDVDRTVVTERLGMQAALVPAADEEPVVLLSRVAGVLGAEGS